MDTRTKVIELFRQRPNWTISQLTHSLDVNPNEISRELQTLRQANQITRVGRDTWVATNIQAQGEEEDPAIPRNIIYHDWQNIVQKLMYCHKLGLNTLLIGPAGSGKTESCRKAAELLRKPIRIIPCSIRTREHHIIGRLDTDEKGLIYFKQGPLVTSMLEGGICCLDELNCLSEDTEVMTLDGPIEAHKLQPNQPLISFREPNSINLGIIQKIYKQPSPIITTVKLEDGTKIECTPNHPFWTKHGWKYATDLRGEKVLKLRKPDSPPPQILQLQMLLDLVENTSHKTNDLGILDRREAERTLEANEENLWSKTEKPRRISEAPRNESKRRNNGPSNPSRPRLKNGENNCEILAEPKRAGIRLETGQTNVEEQENPRTDYRQNQGESTFQTKSSFEFTEGSRPKYEREKVRSGHQRTEPPLPLYGRRCCMDWAAMPRLSLRREETSNLNGWWSKSFEEVEGRDPRLRGCRLPSPPNLLSRRIGRYRPPQIQASELCAWRRVVAINHEEGIFPTYNLETNPCHTFLANGVITHNTAESDTLIRIDEALDHRHEINVEDVTFRAKDGWFACAAINPLDKYHLGTKPLPSQILSRFPVKLELKFPDLSTEYNIVKLHVPDVTAKYAEVLEALTIIHQLRETDLPYLPSIRESIALAQLLASGLKRDLALRMTLIEVYAQWGPSVLQQAKELIESRTGKLEAN